MPSWEEIEGKWQQYRGMAREKWGDFTDDDLDQIGGRRDQLIGKLREKYGMAQEEAEERADEFEQMLAA